MTTTAVIHSEWIKIRSLRSTAWSLAAVLLVTAGMSALICGILGESNAASLGLDPLATSFYGLNFGQIAAISFGALAVSQEFHHSAVRISLAAVPRRSVFYASKMATIGGATLIVGVATGMVTLVVGQALIGDFGIGAWNAAGLRAAVGSGVYLALMALFAAGLTVMLRSGVAVLSVLIPFILIFPFVFNGSGSDVVAYLPDRAGRLIVQQYPGGPVGPWTALGVTALWTAAALVGGWLAVNRRDA